MRQAPYKLFRFWTGPVGVDRYALLLSEAGGHNVKAGTEHVRFEARSLDAAHDLVTEVFPYAAFRVERF
jgi:hypothetical protein